MRTGRGDDDGNGDTREDDEEVGAGEKDAADDEDGAEDDNDARSAQAGCALWFVLDDRVATVSKIRRTAPGALARCVSVSSNTQLRLGA